MKELIIHSFAIMLVIMIPGCLWLVAVFVSAYKQGKKLEKEIYLDEHEMKISDN